MLNPQLGGEVVRAAEDNGIEPAALLAVVEIESSGAPFEQDNETPRFLFERHVFYRELKHRAPARLTRAVAEGLANETWQRNTQYKDQGSSSGRLALLARARAVDEECANRSCSWGLGQTMGFLAEELGFASANAMLAHMIAGGTAVQLDLMIREIRRKNILSALNQHDWERFALRYNGSGYRQNRYDTRLASAYARWRGNEPAPVAGGSLMMGARGDAVRGLQLALQRGGYAPGEIDGIFGSRTRDAVIAFQRDRGLQASGIADPATLQALALAAPLETTSGKETTMERQDILRALLDAAMRQGGGQAAQQKVLQDLLAAAQQPVAPEALSPNSAIDNALGGDTLKGKKTMLAVLAYVVLSILQTQDVVGYATGPTPDQKAAVTKTAPAGTTTAPAPAGQAATPSASSAATPPPSTAATAPVNGQTPTGTILTTLIAAFGGLGFLAKIDRGIKALAMAAGARTGV